jgi:hypothetical protein
MDNELENLPFWKNGLYVDKAEFEKQEREKKAFEEWKKKQIEDSCKDSPSFNERSEPEFDAQQAQPHP